ncbi:MAG: DUF2993 domain-containing protein [Hormoscilla sp. GM7CHS1pb]|nr:DUF2993 domain-containing protein [Hormoscilla sp. GM7CHS1pb]
MSRSDDKLRSFDRRKKVHSRQSQKLKRVLSPAVKLWLRTQVESVAQLQVNMEAGDRLLIAGLIPRISLSAEKAVYQGLHLSHLQLVAEGISINLPQILRGKPLRLQAPVPVVGQIQLESADLNAGLQSEDSLLSRALTDLLCQLLTSDSKINPQIILNRTPHWQKIALEAGGFTVTGSLLDADGNVAPMVIRSGVQLASDRELQLYPLDLQMPPDIRVPNRESFLLDLGKEVEIQELTLSRDLVVCHARVKVMP